jgi:hypothetical protein
VFASIDVYFMCVYEIDFWFWLEIEEDGLGVVEQQFFEFIDFDDVVDEMAHVHVFLDLRNGFVDEFVAGRCAFLLAAEEVEDVGDRFFQFLAVHEHFLEVPYHKLVPALEPQFFEPGLIGHVGEVGHAVALVLREGGRIGIVVVLVVKELVEMGMLGVAVLVVRLVLLEFVEFIGQVQHEVLLVVDLQ